MPEQEWAKSKEGMNPVEISISISMPEFDGIIHGVPVAQTYEGKWRGGISSYFRAYGFYGFQGKKMGVIAQ